MTRARESGERDGRDRECSRLRERSGEQEMIWTMARVGIAGEVAWTELKGGEYRGE